MSITSICTQPLNSCRGRSNRPSARRVYIDPNDPNANDELNDILNAYSMNDLLELRENEKMKQPSIAPKFYHFNQWKKRTTSIADKDSMFIGIINEAIKVKEESKEEEPSPYNNGTYTSYIFCHDVGSEKIRKFCNYRVVCLLKENIL